MIYHLQLIGEAAARLGRDFRVAHPEASWPQIVAMRNILVHEYFGVDTDEVWQVIIGDLPLFKEQVEKLLNILEDSDSG